MAEDAIAGTGGATGRRIRHSVFFWLKNPDSTADRDRLIAGLRQLAAIDEIRVLEIGVPAATEQREVVDHGYSVAEFMVFDSEADQLVYQQHPLHARFVEECSALWDKVVVYDSLILG